MGIRGACQDHFFPSFSLSFWPGMARFSPLPQDIKAHLLLTPTYVNLFCSGARSLCEEGMLLRASAGSEKEGKSPCFEVYSPFEPLASPFQMTLLRREPGMLLHPNAVLPPAHPLYLLGKEGASFSPLYREARPSLQYTSNHWGLVVCFLGWWGGICVLFFTFNTKHSFF